MRIYSNKFKDESFGTSYSALLYITIFLQCLCIGAGALYYDPFLKMKHISLDPISSMPLISLLFGMTIFISWKFNKILSDFFRLFSYKEKFGFFIIHCGMFFLPVFFIHQVSIIYSLLSVNLFLAFCLALPHIFARLYASNMLLLVIIIIKVPNLSLSWVLLSFLLICIPMCFDYFHYRKRKYGETHQVNPGEFYSIIIRYIIIPVLLSIALYIFLPPMHKKFNPAPEIRRHEHYRTKVTTDSTHINDIVVRAVLLGMMLMFLIALVNWVHKKLRGNKPPVVIPLKGFMRKVKKFVKEKIISSEAVYDDIPRDRIIRDYNKLCVEMGKLGYEKSIHHTPSEFLKRVQFLPEGKLDILKAITLKFENVLYGNKEVKKKESRKFRKKIKTLLTSLKGDF